MSIFLDLALRSSIVLVLGLARAPAVAASLGGPSSSRGRGVAVRVGQRAAAHIRSPGMERPRISQRFRRDDRQRR